MNISGIRPKQEFYAGVERREPEKKETARVPKKQGQQKEKGER